MVRMRVHAWLAPTVACAVLAASFGLPTVAGGQQPDDQVALALYADAANFQNNEALALAVETWQKFLDRYPDHPMASNAAHYLGVSQMRREPPEYTAAAEAFARALRDDDSELREESLANRGWCLYASAESEDARSSRNETSDDAAAAPDTTPPVPNRERLRQAIETFAELRESFPESRFLDRAYFYSGEAASLLGEPERAVEFYDRLLELPQADASSLRCDALYGRGVALETLERFETAAGSYGEMLKSCDGSELVYDARLRLGDLQIRFERFEKAADLFATASESASTDDDRGYALLRQAYSLARADRPGEAATTYEALIAAMPESRYAAEARLASAQSTYRSGDMEAAAERFRRVLESGEPDEATEAAHWLARIRLAAGDVTLARDVARRQLDAGASGPYAMSLRLDLAEALAADPDTVAESIDRFEQAYRDAPDDPLAPRALYNAAFSALQANRPARAVSLADTFLERFADDELTPDVRFIAAEGRLAAGRADEASKVYSELVKTTTEMVDVRRPRWVIRAATALNAAGRHDDTVAMLRRELDTERLASPADRAEAEYLVGQAHLAAGRRDPAIASWESVIEEAADPTVVDRARYQLAQLHGREADFDAAIERYDAILEAGDDGAGDDEAGDDRPLRLYAMYGKGWALTRSGRHAEAIEPLDQFFEGSEATHPLRGDALLTRGISRRVAGDVTGARDDLQTLLARMPEGMTLGNALYELALVEQQAAAHAAAAEHLRRIREEVPDYPDTARVLYELAWSLREAGEDAAAATEFAALIRRYPDDPMVAEAAYFLGHRAYRQGDWGEAAERFAISAEQEGDEELAEKSLYRLGWSRFKSEEFEAAAEAFRRQAEAFPKGELLLDAWMMIGECEFKRERFAEAIEAFGRGREILQDADDTARSIRDDADRRIRELILLHGGQSAAQLERFEEAIGWYDELRQRFPATAYLPQVFYATGYAYQQLGDEDRALQFYGEVAGNYRSEIAARARFMMGEIRFGKEEFDRAIPEFQRVMFGFGADEAPEAIKNWQAKSGFEAGRCSEALMRNARSDSARRRARELAETFYEYVLDKHPGHELAGKSRERIEGLQSP